MKRLLLLCAVCLSGCVNVERLNVEKLAQQLSENNASFYLHVEGGSVTIQRANPTIGFAATASSDSVTQSSPTNLPISIQYHSLVPGPTMPQQQPSTNQPAKPK